MIAYCPFCGALEFINYKGGDRLMCKTCAGVIDPRHRNRTRLRLEVPRLVTAAAWLAEQYGSFTRSELARHLGVTNSPHLRQQLDGLAVRGILNRSVRPHEQNRRPTWFYSRPAARARTVQSAGAVAPTVDLVLPRFLMVSAAPAAPSKV